MPNPRVDRTLAVSVVLPVLNEAHDIGSLLAKVTTQAPPPGGFEVIVVDGGSTDRTREIVSGFSDECSNLRLLPNARKLSSAGRNVGARIAKGKYVLFLDGHCHIPRDDYLVRIVEIFESTQAECLCRPQPLDRISENHWAKAISAARHSRIGHASGSDIYGSDPAFTDPRSAGAAYVRTRFEELGGYDERFDACEDVEFNHRIAEAGFKSYVHPDLSVHYRPRSSPVGLFRQMARYGRGRARLMARHPSALPWPLVSITGFVIATVLMFFTLGSSAAGIAMAVAVTSWALLVAGVSVRLGGLSIGAIRIAFAFLMIYAGLVLGFWRGLQEFRRFRSADVLNSVADRAIARSS